MTPGPALLLPALGRARPPDALVRAVRRRWPSASTSCCSAAGRCRTASRRPRASRSSPLPPLGVGPDGRFDSRDRRFTVERAWSVRRERILAVFDATPAGGRAGRAVPVRPREVRPRARPAARGGARARSAVTACSLRDILVSRRATSAPTTSAPARSPTLTSTPCSCTAIPRSRGSRTRSAPAPAARRPRPLHGLRRRRRHAPNAAPRGARGGVGRRRPRRRGPLLRAAAGAQRRARHPDAAGRRAVLPGGRLARPGSGRHRRARARADGARPRAPSSATPPASVSQCGYNTALEVVRAGVPALVVPYATPEEDEQRRRARRLARLGAVRMLDPERLDPATLAREIEGLLVVRAAAARARPRRRAPEHRPDRRPARPHEAARREPRRPHPPALRRCASGGRSPAPAPAPSCSTAADLAKPWPLALVVDRLLAGREAPFELDADDWRLLAAVAALVLAIAVAEAVAQYSSRPLAAERRRAHHARAARRRLRPPPAAVARLPPPAPEGRPRHPRHRRRRRDGRRSSRSRSARCAQAALLALGMVVVLLVIDPVLGLLSLATLPAAGVRELRLPPPRQGAGARAARARGRDRVARQRGAVGDGGREGVRLRALRGRPRRAPAARSGWPRASRSRGCRRGSTGSSASSARSAPRSCSSPASLRVAAGAIGPGELIVFASYTRKAHSPMRSIAREATKIAAAMARAERVAELLAERRRARGAARRLPRRRARGGASRSRTSRSRYEPGRPALRRGLAAGSRAGERVALMGPSGRRQVDARGADRPLLRPRPAGRVLIDGRDVRDCSLAWLRDQVGDRAAGHGPVQRHACARTSPTGPMRRRSEIEAAAARRRRARVHRPAAARLRHPARPPGRGALGRPAPADRHRPHAAARPADPPARRADDRARRGRSEAHVSRASRR